MSDNERKRWHKRLQQLSAGRVLNWNVEEGHGAMDSKPRTWTRKALVVRPGRRLR